MEEYQIALVEYIFSEYERVFGNMYQERMTMQEISHQDKRIGEIEINAYDWS
jgi:hypothetical protein